MTDLSKKIDMALLITAGTIYDHDLMCGTGALVTWEGCSLRADHEREGRWFADTVIKMREAEGRS